MRSLKDTFTPASKEKNKILPGVLYLVATPIGNLADFSERAKKTISEVSFIAAEDTRNAAKLLSILGVHKELVSYYEHNKRERGELILDRLIAGESCALITDAGTPAISDPGEDIVRLCKEKSVVVTAVPGCCAAINALSLSALATGRFAFEGFLTTATSERHQRLEELKYDTRTLIFYEAPHKLCRTLEDFYRFFGNRDITLCREMTKLNEEILRTDLLGAIAHYKECSPRGEYVLVLAGATEKKEDEESARRSLSMTPHDHMKYYEDQGLSRMDAMKAEAKDRGMTKSDLYKQLQDGKENTNA